MDALEEDSFVLSFSSTSDEFAVVVGYLEDISMDNEFQLLQRNFMDKYYLEFEDMEENKLTYTPIFNEHISFFLFLFFEMEFCSCCPEKYIEEQLLEQIPGFNMAAFTTTLQHHKSEAAGDIFDMLLPSQAENEGRGLDLSSGLVVTSLCQSSSVPASQNNLQHWVLPPAHELEHSGCHQPNRLSS
uniref:ADP-ribosylation factor-like protein 2-binding protein n=1 Tax=Nomascus leucogenys TaxID=61853 RepID=M3Z980_NOMLE